MSSKSDIYSDQAFEDEVRRVARALWPDAQFGGSVIMEGRERDAVFITDEVIHVVECTTERKMNKAANDAGKIADLIPKLRTKYPDKFVKGWFVTLHEPTADQRGAVDVVQGRTKTKIVSISMEQFRAKLINTPEYIDKRHKYTFGSSQEGKYIPIDITADRDKKLWTIEDLSSALDAGQRHIIVGDYGAGKSMTMREIFLKLCRKYFDRHTLKFPVLLNLRDHHAQINPAEALERHARNIGYGSVTQLVSAWRAGYVSLMLDGFDEIAIAGWTGGAKKLKDLRFRSMELIRAFIRSAPANAGIIICGRSNFFDNDREMINALLMDGTDGVLRISDFTEKQLKLFLSSFGWKKKVPEWFPSRPLLLGYMVKHNLLKESLAENAEASPAKGWHDLLNRICQREADMDIGVDGETVRQIIERLATKARLKSDQGLGPLSPSDVVDGFIQICGYSPDDKGYVLLQRLPGLGVGNADGKSEDPIDGSRKFIDKVFADAARSGDIFHFITDPYAPLSEKPATWRCGLGPIGWQLAAYRCTLASYTCNKVMTAIKQSNKNADADVLSMDLVSVAQELGCGLDGDRLVLRDLIVPELFLDQIEASMKSVEFHDCIISYLSIDKDIDLSHMPKFFRCYFARVDGRVSSEDLPKTVFSADCTFDEFGDSSLTTDAIMDLPLALGCKVMLTVLRKLYLQRGSGRRQSALFRGLDHKERNVVPAVLDLLKKEELVFESKLGNQSIYLPMRSQSLRVRRLLASPSASNDRLIESCENL